MIFFIMLYYQTYSNIKISQDESSDGKVMLHSHQERESEFNIVFFLTLEKCHTK